MQTEYNNPDASNLYVYAARSENSGGRLFDEPTDPFRTDFQRDRDRIIHAKAFRRLGYKTQVFGNFAGDNYRTRLTHSLEVSQIARSVAGSLHLNRDLSETLALAHDLGHTPFGHAGQDQLHLLMKDAGGFEHNCQSLRIVSVIEERYPFWSGLNLTRLTLKAMMKHQRVYDCDKHLLPLLSEQKEMASSLEMLLVDRCDRIAYVHHDFDDGLDAGYLSFDDLLSQPYWNEAVRQCRDLYADRFDELRRPLQIRTVIRFLLNQCISDLIDHSRSNLEVLAGSGQNQPVFDVSVISNSHQIAQSIIAIYKYLYEHLYRHPEVIQMSRRGERMIEFLFHEFMKQPKMLPAHIQTRIENDGLARVVSDYISGMTDRYAEKQYLYLTGH